MENREKSLGDLYELVTEFMVFTKDQFDQQSIKFEKVFLDLGFLRQEQREIRKEIKGVKEDMDGITGAIAELAEKVGAVEE